MAAGQTLRITDVEGQQVADLVCFRRSDVAEKLSVHNTALIQGKVYIGKDHVLLSDRCGKLMTITQDTCGLHDLLAGSCSEGTNRVRYGVPDTPNCRSEFRGGAEALRDSPQGDPVQLQYFHERAHRERDDHHQGAHLEGWRLHRAESRG
jgi:uncharacterized protein YcgI (DUF1989 family)